MNKSKFVNPYTKEEVKYVLQNWGKVPPKDMMEHLKRPQGSLAYLAKAIRETGYPLPKRPKAAALKFVITEAIAELGLELGKAERGGN